MIKLAKTVEEGFKIFHGRFTPTGEKSEAAKRHRMSTKDCLETNFGITKRLILYRQKNKKR